MENSSKKNSLFQVILIIICILLAITTGALATFICIDKGLFKDKEVNIENNESESSSNNTSESDKEQTDSEDKNISTEEEKRTNMMTELSYKIDALVSMYAQTEYQQSTSWAEYGFKYGLLRRKLTEKDIQFIALQSAEWQSITSDDWKSFTRMKTLASYFETNGDGGALFISKSHQTSEEKVNEKSLSLFGKKIETPVEEVGGCPIYLYDVNQRKYYRPQIQCGGANGSQVKSYKSNFIEIGDEVNVYVSYAFAIPTGANRFIIYKDFEISSEELQYANPTYTKEYKTGVTSDYVSNFKLDETNYQEFSEYKFTFKKDNNDNYYFVSVEQTK